MTESGGRPEAGAGQNARSARETFAELYEQYLPRVFRYISYRVSDVYLAEDLTSDVFEKALKGFNQYRSDKASLSTWLLSIARHRVIDHHRMNSKRQTVPLQEATEVSSDPKSPEEEVIRKEEWHRLQPHHHQISPEETKISLTVQVAYSIEQ